MTEVPIADDIRALLAEFRARLEARFGAELLQMRLFGSYARGDAHDDSDVDVLVVLEHAGFAEKKAVLDIAGDFIWQRGIVVSPSVFSRETYELHRAQERPLVSVIAREGIPV